MNLLPNATFSLLFFSLFVFIGGCKEENEPVFTIPYAHVDEEININSLSYQDLKQPNGFIYLDHLGYKGIVVIRDEESQSYMAFDRACPVHPDEDCAKISMHSSGFFLEDSCCESLFDPQTGRPTRGPATSPVRPLRQYNTFVNSSNYLIIRSI